MEKTKILIVEDAKLIRDRLLSVFSIFNDSLQIDIATRISEAKKSFFESHPDIIILDLSLPDGNGINFLDEVKKESIKTMVIILTNFPFPQVKEKCIELGSDYFFSKENEFDEVLKVIEPIVHRKESKSEIKFNI